MYVIEPKFRQLLGCTQRYLPPTGGLREDQIGRLSKLLNQTKFQRDLEEKYRLGEIEELPLKLKEYAEGFRSCFGRASQLEVVVTFWIGLESHLRRKNAEAIALETGAYAPRTLQGIFYLTEVCRLIPFSAHQIRYQAKRNPRAKIEVGVWKDRELNVFLVDMALFAPWIHRLWAGRFKRK